ncbi:MAG: hypothetical protein PWQ29_1457 [Verrucomicrobiota bacterium]|jgi:integrase|nr:hypothetical protein [Verrucomicrobiota bacterium]MDK2964063.1 hypothetical protein [Verrucomicrobiota bacterium]
MAFECFRTLANANLNNPFAGIPRCSLQTVLRQPFTEKELNAILENCDAMIRPVVLVAMCPAMRRGDCCKLKWDSVDLKNDAGIKNTQSDNENASQKASIKDFHSLRTTWITMALTASAAVGSVGCRVAWELWFLNTPFINQGDRRERCADRI